MANVGTDENLVLKEVYLHQHQTDNGIFDIFHIYELSEEVDNVPDKPAISTNCVVSEDLNRALVHMNDDERDGDGSFYHLADQTGSNKMHQTNGKDVGDEVDSKIGIAIVHDPQQPESRIASNHIDETQNERTKPSEIQTPSPTRLSPIPQAASKTPSVISGAFGPLPMVNFRESLLPPIKTITSFGELQLATPPVQSNKTGELVCEEQMNTDHDGNDVSSLLQIDDMNATMVTELRPDEKTETPIISTVNTIQMETGPISSEKSEGRKSDTTVGYQDFIADMASMANIIEHEPITTSEIETDTDDHPLLNQLLSETVETNSDLIDTTRNSAEEIPKSDSIELIEVAAATDSDSSSSPDESYDLPQVSNRSLRMSQKYSDHSYCLKKKVGTLSNKQLRMSEKYADHSYHKPLHECDDAGAGASILANASTSHGTMTKSVTHTNQNDPTSQPKINDRTNSLASPSHRVKGASAVMPKKSITNGLPVIQSVMSLSKYNPFEDERTLPSRRKISTKIGSLLMGLPPPKDIKYSIETVRPSQSNESDDSKGATRSFYCTCLHKFSNLEKFDAHYQFHHKARSRKVGADDKAEPIPVTCAQCMHIFYIPQQHSISHLNAHVCMAEKREYEKSALKILFKCKDCEQTFIVRNEMKKHCEIFNHRGVLSIENYPTPLAPTPISSSAIASTSIASTPTMSTQTASTPTASTPTASTPTASTPTASTSLTSTPLVSTPKIALPVSITPKSLQLNRKGVKTYAAKRASTSAYPATIRVRNIESLLERPIRPSPSSSTSRTSNSDENMVEVIDCKDMDECSKHMGMKDGSESNSVNVHVCTECDKVFSSNTELDAHWEKHVSDSVQEDQISNKPRLIYTKGKNGDRTVRFMCTRCGLSFQFRRVHALHVKGHTNIPCEVCSEMFNNSLSLKNHVRTMH